MLIFLTVSPITFVIYSVRHNDLYTWGESSIKELLCNAQLGNLVQYGGFGDSAYKVLSDSHVYFRTNDTVLNLYYEAMSSCRECVEWNYGQLKMLFKIFKADLQIQRMKLSDMISVAF